MAVPPAAGGAGAPPEDVPPPDAARREAFKAKLHRGHAYVDARREGRTAPDLAAEREAAELRGRLVRLSELGERLFRDLGTDETELRRLADEVIAAFSLTDTGRQIASLAAVVEELRRKHDGSKESLEAKTKYLKEKEEMLKNLIALHDAAIAALKKAKEKQKSKFWNTPGLSDRADKAGRWGAAEGKKT